MSKFSWTKESAFRGYSLRDANSYARAIVTGPNLHAHYYGQVFTRGMPDGGPFLSAADAADWVTAMLVQLDLVPKRSKFGELPREKREAA